MNFVESLLSYRLIAEYPNMGLPVNKKVRFVGKETYRWLVVEEKQSHRSWRGVSQGTFWCRVVARV